MGKDEEIPEQAYRKIKEGKRIAAIGAKKVVKQIEKLTKENDRFNKEKERK